jgi:hypothetical protein
MNCEKCQRLLSEFVDRTLSDADCAAVSNHLLMCLTCYAIHLDLSAIVFSCRELELRDGLNNQASRSPSNYGQF